MAQLQTVKISHLPLSCSKQDICKAFSQFGRIVSCDVKLGDKTENYAFVNYAADGCACGSVPKAVQAMDSRTSVFTDQLKPIRVTVPPKSLSPQYTLNLSNLPATISEEELTSVCKKFGTVKVKVKTKGNCTFAYANFSDSQNAKAALQYLNNDYRPQGHQIKAVWNPQRSEAPSSHLVSSTPSSASVQPVLTSSQTIKVLIHTSGVLTPDELYEFFSEYGKISAHPKIEEGNPDYAYINFSNCQSADEASRVAIHTYNRVRLTVKLSNKPGRIEKEMIEVKDSDKLVSILLTKPPFLQEAKDIAQQHDVRVAPIVKDGRGLRLTACSQISLPQAKSQIEGLISQIKRRLVTVEASLPCHIAPLFENSKPFQEIEDSHLVELSIAVKGKQPTSLTDFSVIVADQLKLLTQPSAKGPTNSDSIKQFFGSNGTFQLFFEDRASGCKNQFFTVSCRGEEKHVLAAKAALQEVYERETVQRDFELKQNTPDMEKELLSQASHYLVSAKVDKSTTSVATMIITGCCAYVDIVKIALKDAYLDMLQKDSTPSHWEPQTEECELKQVQRGTKEWNDIELRVKTTIPHVQIVKLERIQNKLLWKKYSQEREIIEEKNSGAVNEKELFHGTRQTDPREIYDSDVGFDMRFSAQGMWGQANYFAFNASYSNSYAHSNGSQKEIFLAMVLTGDSYLCESNSSLRKPPKNSRNTGVKNMRYDSVTGTTSGTQVYMTYDNRKAYPAYLITYS